MTYRRIEESNTKQTELNMTLKSSRPSGARAQCGTHAAAKNVAVQAAKKSVKGGGTAIGGLHGKPAAKGTGEKPAAQGTAPSKVGRSGMAGTALAHRPHMAALNAASAFAKKTVAGNLTGSTSAAAGHFAARGHAPSQAHAC